MQDSVRNTICFTLRGQACSCCLPAMLHGRRDRAFAQTKQALSRSSSEHGDLCWSRNQKCRLAMERAPGRCLPRSVGHKSAPAAFATRNTQDMMTASALPEADVLIGVGVQETMLLRSTVARRLKACLLVTTAVRCLVLAPIQQPTTPAQQADTLWAQPNTASGCQAAHWGERTVTHCVFVLGMPEHPCCTAQRPAIGAAHKVAATTQPA